MSKGEQQKDESIGKQMLSQSKFYMGYSRWLEDKQGYESWDEAVARVMNMHREKYKDKMTPLLEEYISFAENAYKEQLVLGAQRALQFGGEQLFKHESRIYNCSVSHTDRPAFFNEAFYLLLCGCGVGFSVQKHHVEQIPDIHQRSKKKVKIFQVPDSIEGWADAVGVLLSSYLVDGGVFPEYKGCQVHFDFTKIRPKGAMISGGFKAPGADGLRSALVKIETLLDKTLGDAVEAKITPIVAYDITMHISDAVLSGGVRRSATICLFDKDDQEMLTAKTGNWFIDNPQRGRSNNSAMLKRDELTLDEWQNIMRSVRDYGEPGFIFTDNLEFAYNPCVEIGMLPRTNSGVSGFQFCVSGDTKLITKDGLEQIGNLVETECEIWNGEEWSTVVPFQTGVADRLHRVFFSDGSYLDATDNHKFLVKHRFQKTYQEVETVELIDLLKTAKYPLSVPRANVVYKDGVDKIDAYDLGFILGDGCATREVVNANLFGDKRFLKFSTSSFIGDYENTNGTPYIDVKFDLDVSFVKELKYSLGLPKEVFAWNKESILSFVAGWADSDGSNASKGIRIYGEESKIRDGQLLLTKVGISSSINLCAKAGEVTNLGMRKSDLYYLQITRTIEIPCQRLNCNNTDDCLYKGKNQVITRIETLGGTHSSFCLNEPKLHQCVFNNVLTKQCNLTEQNGGKIVDKETFLRSCQAAAILGTLQAGYTDFKYLSPATKEITEREALIGVSITGWMNNPDVLFNEENLRLGADVVRQVNKEVAYLLGINQAARTTCAKPSGNASVLLGTASGIHGEHASRYFRNVQMNAEDEVTKLIQERNSEMVEKSVWSASGTDFVVSFPVISKEGSVYREQLLGVKQLEYVKRAQQIWVEAGTNVDLCVDKNLRHNISNTISVDDWDEVSDYLYKNKEWFAGVSLLSSSGDKDYAQAPFTEVLTAEQILATYKTASMFASGLIVDGLHAFENNLWLACDTVLGKGLVLSNENSEHLLKRDWVRRVKKYADKYFDGDVQQATYCLKDCYNLHKWENVVGSMTLIDFSKELSQQSYTNVDTLGSEGCAGGACEISF